MRLRDAVALIGDIIPDFLWFGGRDGTPLYQNRVSAAYTGLSVEELARLGVQVLVHPDDLERLREAWRSARDTTVPVELEFRCRRHDGAFRWFLCQAAPVPEADPPLWVARLTDVHHYRMLETELDRAIRHRDEFLATFAHEIRSPLQAIRQALYVVQAPEASPEHRTRMHEVIERQLGLLVRFTEDCLDFSKVRWNSMTLLPSRITLQALAAEVSDALRPVLEERLLSFEVDVAEPDCELIVDAARISQALMNLLGNAAKYSDPGGRVQLRVHCEDGHALFEVRDWGCGIDPQRLSEIFELFARAPQSGPHRREGLGIGLTVAQHIAQLHGGTIIAHSDGPGCGSRFTLRIPLAAPTRR